MKGTPNQPLLIQVGHPNVCLEMKCTSNEGKWGGEREREEKGEKGDRTKDSPELGWQECSTQPRAGSQTTTEAGSRVLCI